MKLKKLMGEVEEKIPEHFRQWFYKEWNNAVDKTVREHNVISEAVLKIVWKAYEKGYLEGSSATLFTVGEIIKKEMMRATPLSKKAIY